MTCRNPRKTCSDHLFAYSLLLAVTPFSACDVVHGPRLTLDPWPRATRRGDPDSLPSLGVEPWRWWRKPVQSPFGPEAGWLEAEFIGEAFGAPSCVEVPASAPA